MIKSELINGLISARVDEEEVPPSSPSGRTDYSSDEGHYGGGEETDVANGPSKTNLRRRATVQDLGRPSNKTAISRTLSLGLQDSPHRPSHSNKKSARIADEVKSPVHQSHTVGQSRYVFFYYHDVVSEKTFVADAVPLPYSRHLQARQTICLHHL